ncbi:hypothetical protein RSAG8_05583, partial [Rhizoctonia solani AG-8 WAC10335]
MIEELGIASGLLRVTLDRYLRVCSAIQKSYVTRSTDNIVSQDFTERIQDEVHSLLDYESKLQEAKSAITWTRNSAALAPASILPPEILTRIFRFVLSGEQCSSGDGDGVIRYSKHPEWLSHVCSRWRQTTLGLRDLWTHIDLSPNPLSNHRILPRARAYAERSKPLPLYIHTDDSVDWRGYGSLSMKLGPSSDLTDSVIELIASLAPRTRALDLGINYGHIEFHRAALESCLKGCVPGVFSRLAVYRASGYGDCCKTITTSDGTLAQHYHGNVDRPVLLGISEQHLEAILFRCTTLCFDGLFAPWASKAYHGLTELRLTRCRKPQDGSILESVFVGMLKASPQLRVLLFDLLVGAPLPNTTSVELIPLTNLEALAVRIADEISIGRFFRWIAPGPKSLDSLDVLLEWYHGAGGGGFSAFTQDQLRAFFARSNVAEFLIAGPYESYVDDLSKLTSNISELTPGDNDPYWDELL